MFCILVGLVLIDVLNSYVMFLGSALLVPTLMLMYVADNFVNYQMFVKRTAKRALSADVSQMLAGI